MKKSKTKIMVNKFTWTPTITLEYQTLEVVKNYVQLFSIDKDCGIETKRKISSAWSKLGNLSQYL